MEYLTFSGLCILLSAVESELELESPSVEVSSENSDVSGNNSPSDTINDTPAKEIHIYSERIVNETPMETESTMEIDSPWATLSYQDNLAMLAPALVAGIFIGITTSLVAEIISALAKKAKGD